MDRLPRPEKKKSPEKKELVSLETGLEQAIQAIHTVLQKQERALVAVSGPAYNDTNVGKTHLKSLIAQQLQGEGISVWTGDTVGELKGIGYWQVESQVFILGAVLTAGDIVDIETLQALKEGQDSSVHRFAKESGVDLSGIDIRIFIGRPDRPPEEGDYIYNDILINNEGARNKK